MTTLLDTPTVGLEDIQRLAFYVFFKKFNDVLDQVAGYWASRDLEFDTLTSRVTSPTDLEHIPNDNFHEGHKPSLLLGKPSDFPNLSVFANRSNPGPESSQFDQLNQWMDNLLIEIMVKAQDEETVNRRIQRTTEAAILLLTSNPTLGGAVTGFEASPATIISDVFAVRTNAKEGGYQSTVLQGGERYIWQGSQITLQIRKDSIQPPSLAAPFSEASATDFYSQIDQG